MTLIPQVRDQLEIAARRQDGRMWRRQLDGAIRGLPAVAAVAVALGVGAAAVILLRARTGEGHRGATASVAAQPLLRELAVLRRPRARIDAGRFLNSFVTHVDRNGLLGIVDRQLIRLATITSWGEHVYLLPIRPFTLAEIDRFPAPTRAVALRLRRKRGPADQLAFLTYTPSEQAGGGGGGCCSSAADIAERGAGSWGGGGLTTIATIIVPDRVRRVELEFPRQEDRGAQIYPHSEVVSAPVRGNVAAFRIRNRVVDDPFAYMTWYGPGGRVLKQFGAPRALNRVVPAPPPTPVTRRSRQAERDPAIPNQVTVSPTSGGMHAQFTVRFFALLNRARYEYVLSGPSGPNCTKRTTAGLGDWINFGVLGVRGQQITHALSAGYMGRSAWCPGTFRISVWASVPERRRGHFTNALAPFGTAKVTVRP